MYNGNGPMETPEIENSESIFKTMILTMFKKVKVKLEILGRELENILKKMTQQSHKGQYKILGLKKIQ